MVFENAGKFNIGTAIFNFNGRNPGPSQTPQGTPTPTPPNTTLPTSPSVKKPPTLPTDRANLNEPRYPGPNLNSPNAPNGSPRSKALDILFLQDATGSQGPYIRSARAAIQTICTKISSSASLSQGSLRFGLIAFRDHPPQDSSFITRNFGFTCEVQTMKANLAGLTATGGGDGPEAISTALAEALNMEWDEEAVKIVVLITDAPPHGIGEAGDGFPDGSPDQNDPLEVARQMAERGITLYVIACEPSLSRDYTYAVDFYRGICEITSGKMVPLLNAAQLGDYIVGTAVEAIETEALIYEYEEEIIEDVYGQGKPIEEVMQKVHTEMSSRGTQISSLAVEDVYESNATARSSARMWSNCANLSERASSRPDYQPSGTTLKQSFASSSASSPSYGPTASLPRSPYGAPTAVPTPPVLPSVTVIQQEIARPQSDGVVMRALARNAKVEANGMLVPSGRYAGSPSVSRDVPTAYDVGVVRANPSAPSPFGPPMFPPEEETVSDSLSPPRYRDMPSISENGGLGLTKTIEEKSGPPAMYTPSLSENSYLDPRRKSTRSIGGASDVDRMSVTASLKKRWSTFKLFQKSDESPSSSRAMLARDKSGNKSANRLAKIFGGGSTPDAAPPS